MRRVVARVIAAALAGAALLVLTPRVEAQSLGVFRWRLDPFCNVVTLTVTQTGSVFRLEGWDDQCSFPQRAPATGVATLNPDGTVGFGFTIVTTPGGLPVHVDARVSPSTLSGPWTDSAGNAGTFTFGAGPASGTVRPPATVNFLPAPFSFFAEGGFAARGTGGTGAIPASGSGVRMMWYPQQAAFRAGAVNGTEWDAASIGFASTALGQDVKASGIYSFAAGYKTTASGPFSTALGLGTIANGNNATAFGQDSAAVGTNSTALGFGTNAIGQGSLAGGIVTVASGVASVALGANHSTASGEASVAMGINAVASGAFSRSLGYDTIARGVSSTAIGVGTEASAQDSMALGRYAAVSAAAPGSFVYGDASTSGASRMVTSVSPNQFLVRAAGGTAFWSTSATVYPTSPGVILFSGDSAWSSLSDVNAKENFRDLNHDDLLARLAAMPVREWNYKAQDQAIRHIGPTAQDFHAAFGLGQDERRINTLDADGVALAALRALEARTRADNERLTRENDELRERLVRLEQRIAERK